MADNDTKIRVAVIGATGSVGTSALDICDRFRDRFEVVALACNGDADGLLSLVSKFSPRIAYLANPYADTIKAFRDRGVELIAGDDGLISIAEDPAIDHIVFASSGTDAIPALQKALSSDKDVSLANKESIVAAGPWVMPLVKRPDQLRPVDSEHSAIWQCLRDEPTKSVRKIFLTASGGPFRDWPLERMKTITPAQALKHPVWAMGAKITIDSATLMNKGIECIEAMQLFSLPPGKVDALIHPRSLVHGMVEFSDATMKLLFSSPDMRLPSAAALSWPDRLPLSDEYGCDFGIPPVEEWSLEFFPPDRERFPCLDIALKSGELGGAYPPLLVGADQVVVTSFLKERIPFLTIPNIIERTLESYDGPSPRSAEDAIELISEGERIARDIVSNGRFN